jgi:hypothetical protein
MGALARSVVLLGFALAPATAHAHFVPGDPDSGRTVYLLPGPLVSLVVPITGDRPSILMDVGLEVSVFRFVPTSRRFWSQCGYGAFAQAQVGGVQVQAGDTPAPSLHLRLALGAEATFGPLGAHAGLLTRVFTGDHAGMLGAFAGVFLTFGITTASFQVELPFAQVGDGIDQPIAFASTVTLKWPFTLAELPPRR